MSQTGIQPNSNLCAVQRELLWSSERCQDIVDRVCAERPTPARVTTSAPMPGFPGGYSHHGTNPRERRCVEYEVTSQLQTELFPGMLERLAQLNASLYHFSLEGFHRSDLPRILEYSSNDEGHFAAHMDVGGAMSTRKLSFVVMLSKPDEYRGGELEMLPGNVVQVDQGMMIVFLSFLLHQVHPVTQGTRRVLVGWIHGSPFS